MMPYNRDLRPPSQELRNNMTEAERRLWSKLRYKQLKGYLFYRQKPVGGYIVDFYCPRAKLVIEVDGGHHFTDEGKEYDRVRDDCLQSLGLHTLRFSNHDVLTSIDGVVENILKLLPEK